MQSVEVASVLHLHDNPAAVIVVDLVELRKRRLMIVGTE